MKVRYMSFSFAFYLRVWRNQYQVLHISWRDKFYIQKTIKSAIAIIETARYYRWYNTVYFARVSVKLINEKYKILECVR